MTDESLFLKLTGRTPVFLIIDYLMEEKGFDHSKTDIAKGAGISRASLFQHWASLEKNGIVRETRRFGKTKLYTLNAKNPVTRKLLELERTMIAQALVTNANKKPAAGTVVHSRQVGRVNV